jgi:hypothetical protein
MIPTIIMIVPTTLSQLILSEYSNTPPKRGTIGKAEAMGTTREIVPYLMA